MKNRLGNIRRDLTFVVVAAATLCVCPRSIGAGNSNPPVAVGYSYSRPDEIALKHADLTITVDFKKRQLTGRVQYEIENTKRVTRLVLDTRDLSITNVALGRSNAPTAFELGRSDSVLGSPLLITVTPETKYVTIEYTTSPQSAALQWLKPAQTAGMKMPFLYTHSEPIMARAWIPCQDLPSVRLTYRATVKTPPGMLVVMSGINPQKKNSRGIYELDMPQPIPPYLFALAVGDIDFRSTGKRTGVYAEPSILPKCSREFTDLERLVAVAESLYGPYRWGRYDVLVLPPAFPIGGMENPRLTFATPTIIAGDKSLVSLIAHELGHSWSGNLVTNGTWNDIWLNEGVTTYVERRIVEAVYGKDVADMQAVLGRYDLDQSLARTGMTDPNTQLYLDLGTRDPDDEGRTIVYEKGYLFLRSLEEAAGRRRWDAFLRTYFDRFAYQSITTTQFISYYRDMLAKHDSVLNARVNVDEWVYRPGLPAGAPVVHSLRLQNVDHQVAQWQTGTDPRPLKTSGWKTQEWVYFLQKLPDTITAMDMGRLDIAFGFTGSTNAEILSAWLLLVAKHHYLPAFPRLQVFLVGTGRLKYLFPIYQALATTHDGMESARVIFAKAKPGYHPLTVRVLRQLLGDG